MGKWNILALSKLNRNYLYDRRKLGSILEAAKNKEDWLRLASLDKVCVNECLNGMASKHFTGSAL